MSQDNFQVGDTVKWTSQAAGSAKTKEGRIVAMVPEGSQPQHKIHGTAGGPRKGTSYVIEVARPKSVKHYWPRASALKLVSKPS